MGRLKRAVFAVMILAFVVVVTACGRNDNMNPTTAPRTSPAPTEMTTEVTREIETETGGILQDMIDDLDNVNGVTTGKK